ncbi:MAG: flavin reductase family protein [Sulfurovum sp.]|nr:flavin reductase family protein [Sulfurovum sp.]
MFNVYETLERSDHSQPRVAALLACKGNLMAASWHMPISKSPFRYAVAVREENYTHALLSEYGSFTLNFLPYEYYETVDLMGRLHGDECDKLRASGLKSQQVDTNGNPLLDASDFIYACNVCDTYTNGDHTIFIADVVRIYVNAHQSKAPMLFFGRGRYATACKDVVI